MKITCLLGSPRKKGNSATIANRFVQTAESLGAQVKTFALNDMKFRGCQACMACKTKLDHCAVKDDLTEVLDDIRDSDVLVLATPTYFHDISAQMKGFIDRTYSYLVPDFMTSKNPSRLSPGKQLVFIQTQAQPDRKMFENVFPKYEIFFNRYGFKNNHLIRACGVSGPDDASNQEGVLKEAEETAKKVMNSD